MDKTKLEAAKGLYHTTITLAGMTFDAGYLSPARIAEIHDAKPLVRSTSAYRRVLEAERRWDKFIKRMSKVGPVQAHEEFVDDLLRDKRTATA